MRRKIEKLAIEIKDNDNMHISNNKHVQILNFFLDYVCVYVCVDFMIKIAKIKIKTILI
jgi:uncharacterized protein YeeX (DUF496 family)